MKNSLVQIGIGFLPIVLGFLYPIISFLPLFLVNILFFAVWVWLCFRFTDPAASLLPQLLRILLPGAVIIALALWQELVPNNNLPAVIMQASNFYFLSGIQLAGRILTPFLRTITAWPYYIVDYAAMAIAAILSVVVKKKVA
ncbi:MAG: hypothetical protein IJE81_04680 [Oscillospiraceae bacterium]|nr:hypothetical protein [Oscillospiraceae bacterium]MBQ7130341.1 hypothetical protein [Oscillospiraceae bacterium]